VLIGEVLAFVVVIGLVGEVGRFSVLHQRVRSDAKDGDED
jgi:hypothetical protein